MSGVVSFEFHSFIRSFVRSFVRSFTATHWNSIGSFRSDRWMEWNGLSLQSLTVSQSLTHSLTVTDNHSLTDELTVQRRQWMSG